MYEQVCIIRALLHTYFFNLPHFATFCASRMGRKHLQRISVVSMKLRWVGEKGWLHLAIWPISVQCPFGWFSPKTALACKDGGNRRTLLTRTSRKPPLYPVAM
ncbi:hypothetical protein POVWA2_006630 [Plasmodium ovale wallikeri]|uniref:Uncharacterized protein n=1 Tax=Plasmodium ovale wallikeri TaxID=864142 RepID=A0A1A8YIB2_PLAOA|nr:hypothetical protein POVWA1_006400 [Plasmodium ovale wallikeri]SBT31889.1 hypothetical protein POVWA2_006630 [Plasmodium ovale wallikeri]